MRQGAESIEVRPPRSGDGPAPPRFTIRAHVSWADSAEQRVHAVDAIFFVVSRYIAVTYDAEHVIPNGAICYWRGEAFETEGPEEVHTDMRGRVHHKTRRLKAAEFK